MARRRTTPSACQTQAQTVVRPRSCEASRGLSSIKHGCSAEVLSSLTAKLERPGCPPGLGLRQTSRKPATFAHWARLWTAVYTAKCPN